MLVWSYGGGTQSAAIGCMIVKGVLRKPDITVMADTGREASETWAYLRDHVQPYLATAGITVEIAPPSLAREGMYTEHGTVVIPAFVGGGGKLRGFCARVWKIEVVAKWLKQRGVREFTQWLGISFEERHRAKGSEYKRVTYEYPLLDRFITRQGCYRIVEEAGLPRPPKSSCWCCPHRKDHEWERMRELWPEDWKRAVELDEEARLIRITDGEEPVFLHRSMKPLQQVTLKREADQFPLFAGCDTGACEL